MTPGRPLVLGGLFILLALLLGALLVALVGRDPHLDSTERWDHWLAIGTVVFLFANLTRWRAWICASARSREAWCDTSSRPIGRSHLCAPGRA